MPDDLTDTELAYAQARAYGKDVARLYAAEKARRSELEITTQKLQAIFDTAPNSLGVIDNELNVLEANPRFLALFQQTPACLGRPLSEFLPVDGLLAAMETMRNGSVDLANVEIEVTEPVLRSLLVNLAPLNDEQGWVLIFHDLTERKRLEGLKDEFVNIAAHELRTPLAGVMGFVGVLQEELRQTNDPMMANLTDLILQSTERLRGIIDELVDFAATQRSTPHHLHIADIDLSRLLQKSVDSLQQKIEAKEINCQLDLPEETLIVRGDQFIMGDVIYQLLSNAIIFNKPGGEILVRAYTSYPDEGAPEGEDRVTLIEIADTGIGIPSTDLEKIFDRFYQVEEHLTRGFGGLGLGLTIARRGVEQHGGELTVTSQLGEGSTFKVTLPPLAQLQDVSIDSRLDVAHQQMLTYAKDMAQAVASQRRASKKLDQVQNLTAVLNEKLEQLRINDQTLGEDNELLNQLQEIGQELIRLSQPEAV